MSSASSNPSPTTTTSLTITTAGQNQFLSLSAISEVTGLHQDLILEFARAELVSPAPHAAGPGEGPYFDSHALCRLRQIAELRERQKVNLRTVKFIVQLMDRLEEAESELQFLRETEISGR